MALEEAVLSAPGRKLTYKETERSGRRSLQAGRKRTDLYKGRCSCQQVTQGQCPQRDSHVQ